MGLGVLLSLRACQAQPASPARATAPTPVAARRPSHADLDLAPAVPDQFVVRRSLDGGTWQDVAVLLGASGTGLTWQDTTLPAPAEPVVAQYVIYAVTSGIWQRNKQ